MYVHRDSTLLDLDPAMVLYSHGGGMTTADLIRHNIGYLHEAERRCRQALQDGMRPDGVNPEALDWPIEAALPPGQVIEDPQSYAFYEHSHSSAVKAVAAWLASPW